MTDEVNESSGNTKSIKTMVILIALVAIVAAVVFYFYVSPDLKSVPPEPLPTTTLPVVDLAPQPSSSQPASPPPAYEAPQAVVEPLPNLNESDTSVLAALQGLSTQTLRFAVPKEILRKFVRAVNAIEEGKVVHEYRPIVSPPPAFTAQSLGEATADQPEQFRLPPENFERYDNYVTLLAMLDTDAVAALYQRFYPLLEEAYAEMGLKKGNFHSVLIGAIDNLLAAPVVEGEILLVRPKVFYQFADPAIEKLPSTHKLLLRMGPENTRSFQASLKNLRVNITQ
jgi:hypothetical protein